MERLGIQSALILFALLVCSNQALAQDDLSRLLSRFQTERDIVSKEATLRRITTFYPESGPALLRVARSSKDGDTQWLAIRGMGDLRFAAAAPFLKQHLSANAHYVRANAARALGDMHDLSAIPDLMRALKKEEESGAIEQMAFALQTLGATNAIPLLKDKTRGRPIQTLLWLLGSIDILGTRAEVPFFASFLSYGDHMVEEFSAHALERLTGEDFGFPRCNINLCIPDSSLGIANARSWWANHQTEWKNEGSPR